MSNIFRCKAEGTFLIAFEKIKFNSRKWISNIIRVHATKNFSNPQISFRSYSVNEQPEYPWTSRNCEPTYWQDKNNQTKFVHWASLQFHIKDLNDWYTFTPKVSLHSLGLTLGSRFHWWIKSHSHTQPFSLQPIDECLPTT